MTCDLQGPELGNPETRKNTEVSQVIVPKYMCDV